MDQQRILDSGSTLYVSFGIGGTTAPWLIMLTYSKRVLSLKVPTDWDGAFLAKVCIISSCLLGFSRFLPHPSDMHTTLVHYPKLLN